MCVIAVGAADLLASLATLTLWILVSMTMDVIPTLYGNLSIRVARF